MKRGIQTTVFHPGGGGAERGGLDKWKESDGLCVCSLLTHSSDGGRTIFLFLEIYYLLRPYFWPSLIRFTLSMTIPPREADSPGLYLVMYSQKLGGPVYSDGNYNIWEKIVLFDGLMIEYFQSV